MNRLQEIWASGGAVVNAWCSIPSSFSAEVMAHQGFDSITIDMQHGLIGYQVATTMLQAIAATPVVPLVRVPWRDPGSVMKILDAGAMGVICPMINTRRDAEELVSACKYPPRGFRSFGPVRAKYAAGGSWKGGGDYHVTANEDTLVIPMIETKEAIRNLNDILDVPGVAGIYVGPSDLSMSHGKPPRSGARDPEVIAARRAILAGAQAKGIPAGIHTNSRDVAVEMVGDGFQLVTLQSDERFLTSKASEELTAVREGIEGLSRS